MELTRTSEDCVDLGLELESWSSIPRSALMARYRIKQKPSYCTPERALFDAEERCWFWWEHRGTYLSLQEAEERVEALKALVPVKAMVIKEYD